MENERFCKQLPKIELHAHLNGSLTAASLEKLGCSSGTIEEYQKRINLLKCISKKDRLEKCFPLFRIPHNVTTTRESVYQATKDVIEDFYRDNVIYLELRTTPRRENFMTKIQYIEAVIRAIKDCENNIIIKLILSIDRSCSLETAEDTMKLIIAMKRKYPSIIKGVDFSGNPFKGSFNKKIFKCAVENGLLTTLHCAENSNHEEANEILSFRPNRIGHATCLHPNYGGNRGVWELYCSIKIPLECCLTSNVICGTAPDYRNHHLQEWIDNSLPFTLCTDDKGIFDTSLSQELILAMHHLNLTPEDIWKITYNSIDFTFAADSEKEVLREKLQGWKLKNHF